MKLHYWKFPACFSEDYASLGLPFFLLFVQLVPAFLSDNHSVTGESRGITGPFKRATGTGAFSTQNLGMAEIFLAGVLVSFVKLMAYGSIGVGSSFLPGVYFVSCNCALFSALIVAGYGTTSPRCQNCASR